MNNLNPKNKYLVLIAAVAYLAFIGFDFLHSSGQVGATRKNGDGCTCHGNHLPTDSVFVWMTGPDTVKLGAVATYTMYMRGGPAVAGGFNIATGRGALLPFDGTSQVISSELTHTTPKLYLNDTVQWKFFYQAPLSGTADTLFGVGNSVDLNGNPTGDEYNFSPNVLVHLKDTTTDIEEEQLPLSFQLYQNYPNPFNPMTHVGFTISDFGLVSLKVYDLLGRKVGTLVNEAKQPGTYAVEWDASGFASGVYSYELRSSNLSQVKKMILIH